MDTKDIIKTTGYIDFINKLDNLVNELLYSKEEGFINLSSKDALDSAQKIIDKFSYEADKIIRESGQNDIENVIINKKDELIKEVKKHYIQELHNWSYSVFEQAVNNCIFKISLCSKDEKSVNEIYNFILFLISWISDLNSFSSEKRQEITNEIESKIQRVINTKDDDYINKTSPDISKSETYLKIRDMIKNHPDEFLLLDLNNYAFELSSKDISYFNNIKVRLKTNNNEVTDEINMVDYSMKLTNIKSDDDKYNLIIQIQDDLADLKDKDEKIKISTIKRRIAIFQNKDSYYKKLFGF